MTSGMTAYKKIAISLPSKAAEHVRKAVREGRAASASAYVARAIEERAKLDDLATLLDEMLAESGGPLTAAETRAIDRAIDGRGVRRIDERPFRWRNKGRRR